MNKNIKYILFGTILFFVIGIQVKAKTITCTYNFVDNGGVTQKIKMKTKDGGQTWYNNQGLMTFFNDFNIIDGFTHSVSSEADCPSDNTYNFTKEKYHNANRPEITYDKYTFGDTPPTLLTDRDYVGGGEYGDRNPGGGGNSAPLDPTGTGQTTCQNLFEGLDDELDKIFGAVKIVVPILVIIFSSLDFAKAIFGGNEDDVKKAQIKFAKRLIVAVIFFLLPTFMAFAMDIMNVVYNGGNFDCFILG